MDAGHEPLGGGNSLESKSPTVRLQIGCPCAISPRISARDAQHLGPDQAARQLGQTPVGHTAQVEARPPRSSPSSRPPLRATRKPRRRRACRVAAAADQARGSSMVTKCRASIGLRRPPSADWPAARRVGEGRRRWWDGRRAGSTPRAHGRCGTRPPCPAASRSLAGAGSYSRQSTGWRPVDGATAGGGEVLHTVSKCTRPISRTLEVETDSAMLQRLRSTGRTPGGAWRVDFDRDVGAALHAPAQRVGVLGGGQLRGGGARRRRPRPDRDR